MKLSQLLSLFPQLGWGDTRTEEVLGLSSDSRQIKPGWVFVAVKGFSQDGHQFIQSAVDSGAIALVVEDKINIPKDFSGAVVQVDNARKALDKLAARFYGDPAANLFCVGITGTNGKTSVTYMVEHLLTAFGWPTGVLGTINHHLGDKKWEAELTTPDPVTLQKRMREFNALNAKAVAFEVSSHALDQGRADQIPFDVGVFTNLTRDHLDYHQDMESYFSAKQKLFSELLRNSPKPQTFAILNADDPYGKKIKVGDGVRRWFYSEAKNGRQDQNSDFSFKIVDLGYWGSQFTLATPRGSVEVKLPIPGKHNVYNSVAALAVAVAAGMSLDRAAAALTTFKGVPGRLEAVENSKGIHVFVDYAHTDDALQSVLNTLGDIRRLVQANNKIITVFGCGGDRDKGKRPLMAQVAERLSDLVIITSDNPRTEEPSSIIEDCLKGLNEVQLKQKVKTEVDRRKAIASALQFAEEGDVILIAGKGHEKYQIIGKEKKPFDDVAVAKEILG